MAHDTDSLPKRSARAALAALTLPPVTILWALDWALSPLKRWAYGEWEPPAALPDQLRYAWRSVSSRPDPTTTSN
jgi:hypothetical protein